MITYDAVLKDLQARTPGLKVVCVDDSALMTFLRGWGWNKASLTLGKTIYMQERYIGNLSGAIILKHEAVHVQDMMRFSVPFFLFTYFFCLPAVFSMRAFWEWRAYKKTIEYEFERTGGMVDTNFEEFIIGIFTTSMYFWMFPFPGTVRKMIRAEVRRLAAARLNGQAH